MYISSIKLTKSKVCLETTLQGIFLIWHSGQPSSMKRSQTCFLQMLTACASMAKYAAKLKLGNIILNTIQVSILKFPRKLSPSSTLYTTKQKYPRELNSNNVKFRI